ncbi:hypothetical protein Hanom_Chr05g00407361 [Helianthus anomalus]
MRQSREERHARMRLDDVYDAYKEATGAGRWSKEKECYVDPQGNPAIDHDKVDFEALVAATPTVGVWCKGLEEIPRYREKVEEDIKKVMYASLEKKKKTVEEIVDESEKLVNEVKKADEKAEEAVAEKQQVLEEDQNENAEGDVPNTEVTTQTDSFDPSIKIDNKAEQQCKKCMETCNACTEKDENLKSEILSLLR